MKKLKLGQKGFTIVELLIVIVIIGILATIGFVAFSGAQNKAKKSNAESTLSQIKSKLGEYNAEEDTYPTDKDALITFLTSDEGGNNDSLAAKIDEDPAGELAEVTYTGDDDGFTLTAPATLWGGTAPDDNIVLTN